MNKLCKKQGFTLVETIAVLGITAALVALLFAIFKNQKQRARESYCLTNQRQIVAAMQMYVQDNGSLPTSAQWRKTAEYGWRNFQSYAKNQTLFFCPSPFDAARPHRYERRISSDDLTLIPVSDTVVCYCDKHGTSANPVVNTGTDNGVFIEVPYLVTRWDGSTQRIRGDATRRWYFRNGQWHQYLATSTQLQDNDIEAIRFPNETWPLVFE